MQLCFARQSRSVEGSWVVMSWEVMRVVTQTWRVGRRGEKDQLTRVVANNRLIL